MKGPEYFKGKRKVALQLFGGEKTWSLCEKEI